MMGLRRMLMAGAAASVPFTAFAPSSLSPLATLAVANRRLGANATGPSGSSYANAKSVAAIVGKRYFSATCTKAGSQNFGLGICDAGHPVGNTAWAGFGQSAALWYEGRIYMNGGTLFTKGALVTPAEIQIAVDAATRRFWMRAAGQAWWGDGNPTAGTAPTGTLPGTGAIHILASIDSRGAATGTIELPATADLVTGTAPSGFTVGV